MGGVQKQTYSKPGIWQPDVDADETVNGVPAKAIATSGIEVSRLKLVGNAGAAHIAIHDCNEVSEVSQNNKKWVLDASTSDTDNDVFPNPLAFKHGMVAVLEQGTGTNPVLCFSTLTRLD